MFLDRGCLRSANRAGANVVTCMHYKWNTLAVAGLISPLLASTLIAQPGTPSCGVRGSQQWLATRPSPLDSATLTVGTTIAKICYSRPSARGRPVDSLVQLARAWRTGANEPTTLTLTGTLDVGGARLRAGRYVILTVPQAEQWLLVFHTTPDTEPAKMFVNLTQVATGSGRLERLVAPIERFTIRPVLDSAEAAFVLEWGEHRARVPVRPLP